MARQTFKIEGLRELERGLRELPKATGKNVLKRVLMKAGAPIVADAKARAPVFQGHLEHRIAAGTKLSRRQKSSHVKMSTVEIHVGAANQPHPHMQEFGTAHHAPQPFMRPAWDGGSGGALETIKADLGIEIEKSRQRAARKAARIAAKNRSIPK